MSSSISDQITALGLSCKPPSQLSSASQPQAPRKRKRPNSLRPALLNGLLDELPMLGEIASLQSDRGFGLLTCTGQAGFVLFHFTTRQGHHPVDGNTLSIGEPILFIVGTDPRKEGRPRAVRWAYASDLPWSTGGPPRDQASLDALRRVALAALPLAALCNLVRADWYVQQWGGNAPDELKDPVLISVWFDRITFASPDALAKCSTPRAMWMKAPNPVIKRRLMEWYLLSCKGVVGRDWEQWFQGRYADEAAVAEFFMDQNVARNEFVRHWIRRIIDKGWLSPQRVEQWVGNDDAEALALFRHLSEKRQEGYFEAWKRNPSVLNDLLDTDPSTPLDRLVFSGALALDLETDGQDIWEIGCARSGRACMLYAPQQSGELASAMTELRERIFSALLVVGHNLVAWDWPIVSRHIQMARPPLLWDTLLVQYLLEPQARSHALGGSHHADADALVAAQLFEQQSKRLPAIFWRSLLNGEFKNTVELLDEIVRLVGSSTSCARAVPDWLKQPGAEDAVLVLPDHLLHEVDWVPGVVVVPATRAGTLPQSLLQVDVEVLARALENEAGRQPAARVLLAVARRGATQGIALRFGMIPRWLLESSSALETAIRQACLMPDCARGVRVAPLPRNVKSLQAAGPAAVRLVGFIGEVLVFDHRPTASSQLSEMARIHSASPLLRIRTSSGEEVWLQADGPSRILSKRGRWRSFRTQLLQKNLAGPVPAHAATLPHPVLATRRTHALYPGTLDQAAYWMEVLRTFREVASHTPDAVPILLVVSTFSKKLVEMLKTGLAALEWGEVRPSHRSREVHLLRAARNHWALVDVVECWSEWQAIARNAGVSLLPVVEALPVEQWYAARHVQSPEALDATRADADDAALIQALDPAQREVDVDDDEGDEETEVAESLSAAVAPTPTAVWSLGASDLLKEMASLVGQHLHAWLHQSGFFREGLPAILIDTRAAGLSKELATSVRLLPLHEHEAPLSTREADRLHQVFETLQIRREHAPSDYASMEKFLIANWQPPGGGKDNPVLGFKESQKSAMETICARASDVVVSLPTGEGKSVLFQVPALCRGLRTRRLTLVLSPLKALMRDQVEGLRVLGFSESADYLSSDRPSHEVAEVLQGVLDHRIVLLYVAPERLRSGLFVDVLRKRVESDGVLEYAVVDETHCVNQWGYEFRPDYFHALNLLLREFRVAGEAEHTPFILLSATITAADRQRLRGILDAAWQPGQSTLPFEVRPNAFEQPLRSHIEVRPMRVHGRINDRDAFDQVLRERLITITKAIGDAKDNQNRTKQRSAVIIFVSRREHAQSLAQRLAMEVNCAVDYYHAGLDAATREDVYQRFRDGGLDVLVATKAFGMGMDIPDIHWAIHLAPPAFLEDYLQEVGRIGRGEAQRQRAQLNRLPAILLFSSEDFESLRSQRATSALQVSFIKDQYQRIVSNAHAVDGQWMAVVPHDGFDPPSFAAARRIRATKLRLALYWLERGGFITLCGSVPNLLAVTIHRSPLERIANGEDELGGVARVILGIESVHQHVSQLAPNQAAPNAAGSWLGRVLGRLSDMVGLLLGTTQQLQTAPPLPVPVTATHAAPATSDTPAPGDALVNLSQIMLRCSLKTLSDVMACLVDLEKRGGLTLKRDFEFATKPLASEPTMLINELFDGVERATQELTRRLSATGELRFVSADLAQDYVAPAVDPKKSSTYQKAFERGVVSFSRLAGASVRQVVERGEVVRWEARLDPAARYQANQRQKTTLRIARAVFELLRCKAELKDKVVSLKELIEVTRDASLGQRFRESDLQRALSLLSAMGLMSLSFTMLPMSYVLTLDSLDGALDSRQDLWAELEQVNRLAELRNDAMEIFANLPTDAQSGFIEGYFSQADEFSLEAFLETQLGDIEDQSDDGLSSFIQDKREHLRASGVVDFFKRYQQSEEPNQWKAITHPYDQHLLVNAGPGSGKTSVLVGRVVHLIREQHVLPSEIIVLAFNRAVVFEIRKRIRDVFRTLGYASHVKRLRVSTFHSFAMRALASADGGQSVLPDQKDVLSTLARRLSDDRRFCQQVVGDCRSILVDEFQDVTKDVYDIVRHLHLGSGSGAGVMVIGDDDQDILRWKRLNGEFSERYFRQFTDDFGGAALTSLLLGVNFRSGAAIVDRSQTLISKFLGWNGQSHRLKNLPLLARRQQPVASGFEQIDSTGQPWQQVLGQVEQMCQQHASNGGGSLAILCRSNAEVAQVHRRLLRILPGLAVQGNANFRVADLRHVGFWLEYLVSESQRQNQVLTNGLKQKLIDSFRQTSAMSEARPPATNDVRLEDLWDLCCEEQAFPHISDLIRFIQDLQTDEFVRLRGSRQERPLAVVSTIHKVKGLEFDSVIVLPSLIPFGSNATNPVTREMDAAEEARLLYVAMTRAKHRLIYFVGDRERAWGCSVPGIFLGGNARQRVLIGSHEDVSLGWAMETIDRFNQNPDACQDYIENEIRIGDPIILGGSGSGFLKGFFHRGPNGTLRQIGFLAKQHDAGGTNASLQVSAVVRFRPDPQPNGTFATKLAKSVQKRGWGYVVLVSGQLS